MLEPGKYKGRERESKKERVREGGKELRWVCLKKREEFGSERTDKKWRGGVKEKGIKIREDENGGEV